MTNRDVSGRGAAWRQACPHPSQPSSGVWGKGTQRAALASPHIHAGLCTVCLSRDVGGLPTIAPHSLSLCSTLAPGCAWLCAPWVSLSPSAALCKPFCWLESFGTCCATLPAPWKRSGLPQDQCSPTTLACPSLLHPVLGVHPFHCPREAAESPRLHLPAVALGLSELCGATLPSRIA